MITLTLKDNLLVTEIFRVQGVRGERSRLIQFTKLDPDLKFEDMAGILAESGLVFSLPAEAELFGKRFPSQLKEVDGAMVLGAKAEGEASMLVSENGKVELHDLFLGSVFSTRWTWHGKWMLVQDIS